MHGIREHAKHTDHRKQQRERSKRADENRTKPIPFRRCAGDVLECHDVVRCLTWINISNSRTHGRGDCTRVAVGHADNEECIGPGVLTQRCIQLSELLHFIRATLYLPGDADNLSLNDIDEADANAFADGLRPGKCRRANASLTTHTGAVPILSSSLKARPETIGSSSVSK